MAHLPDLSRLMHARKDTLILALWAQVQELLAANATCRQPTDSEQAIRPSTTFRKVTGGFRSNWGADFHASVRSVLNTGRCQGMSAFQSIQAVIVEEPLIQTG